MTTSFEIFLINSQTIQSIEARRPLGYFTFIGSHSSAGWGSAVWLSNNMLMYRQDQTCHLQSVLAGPFTCMPFVQKGTLFYVLTSTLKNRFRSVIHGDLRKWAPQMQRTGNLETWACCLRVDGDLASKINKFSRSSHQKKFVTLGSGRYKLMHQGGLI